MTEKNQASKIIEELIGRLHDYEKLITIIKEAKLFTKTDCKSFDDFLTSDPDFIRFKNTAFKLREIMRDLNWIL